MLEELALTILHRHDSVAFPHTHAQLAYKHTLTLLCVCVNVYRINACMRVCMMCVRMHLRYVHQQRSAQNIVSWRLLVHENGRDYTLQNQNNNFFVVLFVCRQVFFSLCRCFQIFTNVYVYIHTYSCRRTLHLCTYEYAYVHIHINIYIYIYVCTYTHI